LDPGPADLIGVTVSYRPEAVLPPDWGGNGKDGVDFRHVYGFTLELHTDFIYSAGKGQTFNFQGDDVWVFINGRC
jgi:hypothetical protein